MTGTTSLVCLVDLEVNIFSCRVLHEVVSFKLHFRSSTAANRHGSILPSWSPVPSGHLGHGNTRALTVLEFSVNPQTIIEGLELPERIPVFP